MATPSVQIQISEPEYKLLQTLVYQECGMYFDERRAHFLQDRLQRRLKICGLDTFYAYYRLLTSHQGKSELSALVENLTVNETSFFRNKPQLELFQKTILEELLKRKQDRRDWSLRLWCAGCSTGQEPYTMAMQVCDALAYYYLRNPLPFEMPTPKPLIPPPWKVEILASDINYSVLRTAQEGLYPEGHMDAVDYAFRLRYVDKVQTPIAPWVAGLAVALVSLPIAAFLPLVGVGTAIILGASVGAAVAHGVRDIKRGGSELYLPK